MIDGPDAYSTHQVPLISAVLQTEGPVVEFGMGHYTTPILHELCFGRKLLSIEGEPEWAKQFEYLATGSHIHFVVANHKWETADEIVDTQERYGVAFIDHGDMEYRVRDIRRMANRAEFIVVHDSNVPGYKYADAFAEFKFCSEYEPNVIHTTVLSNVRAFELRAATGDKRR